MRKAICVLALMVCSLTLPKVFADKAPSITAEKTFMSKFTATHVDIATTHALGAKLEHLIIKTGSNALVLNCHVRSYFDIKIPVSTAKMGTTHFEGYSSEDCNKKVERLYKELSKNLPRHVTVNVTIEYGEKNNQTIFKPHFTIKSDPSEEAAIEKPISPAPSKVQLEKSSSGSR